LRFGISSPAKQPRPNAILYQNILRKRATRKHPPFQTAIIILNKGTKEEAQVAAKFFAESFWKTQNDQLLNSNYYLAHNI